MMHSTETRWEALTAIRSRADAASAALFQKWTELHDAQDALRLNVCERNSCYGAHFSGFDYEGKCTDCLHRVGTALEREVYAGYQARMDAIERERAALRVKTGRVWRAEQIYLQPRFGGRWTEKPTRVLIADAFAPVLALFGLKEAA